LDISEILLMVALLGVPSTILRYIVALMLQLTFLPSLAHTALFITLNTWKLFCWSVAKLYNCPSRSFFGGTTIFAKSSSLLHGLTASLSWKPSLEPLTVICSQILRVFLIMFYGSMYSDFFLLERKLVLASISLTSLNTCQWLQICNMCTVWLV
jgi:hypothetical protein